MISDKPIASATALVEVVEKARAFVESAKVAAADGISLAEFSELTVALLRVTMQAIESVPLPGPERKAWVLDAVAMLFDAVADKTVPLPVYPLWVLVRGPMKSLVLALASGAIESLLPMIRSER